MVLHNNFNRWWTTLAGKKHGPCFTYHETGGISTQEWFVLGETCGRHYGYYENGNKKSLSDIGGITITWHENGSVNGIFIKKAKTDSMIIAYNFHSDGLIKSYTNVLVDRKDRANDMRQGEGAVYRRGTITLSFKVFSERNKVNGPYTEYRRNGAVKRITPFVQDNVNGVRMTFHKSGVVKSTTDYINNERNGEHIVYGVDGNIILTQHYVDDVLCD